MNKTECYIVSDLLPLYMDHTCSDSTAKDIEAHLRSCETCKKLYDRMNSQIAPKLPMPEWESKKIFGRVCKTILAVVAALSVMISCIVVNAGAAWEGGMAGVGSFLATSFYIFFWGVFTLLSRSYRPLIKSSFVMGLLTFISSANGLLWNLLGQGGFLSAFISIFAAIPFYGLRLFVEWGTLYAIVTILSLSWIIYTGIWMRKLEKSVGA